MSIPTIDEAYAMLRRYHVPENILKHSIQVTKVAMLIAGKINEKHPGTVDVDMLHRSAMLHDILKYVDFKDFEPFGDVSPTDEQKKFWQEMKDRFEGKKHTEAAYELLKERYPEIALAIRKHDYKAIISDDSSLVPRTMEEKILTYADKRVSHEKIVTLGQRFKEGHMRWKKNNPKIYDEAVTEDIDAEYFKLEKELFKEIDIDPDKISEHIS